MPICALWAPAAEPYVDTMTTTINHARVVSVRAEPTLVTVAMSDGSSVECNRFWLRDNCPSNGDRASLFRSFSVASMTDELTIVRAEVTSGELSVEFSDGVEDRFPVELLVQARPTVDEAPLWRAWKTGDAPIEFSFRDVQPAGAARHALLEAVARDGVVIVTAIPADGSATETMASWLGPIRETDFGRIFDIVTEPDPFTPSQSESALDPHTDDPYR